MDEPDFSAHIIWAAPLAMAVLMALAVWADLRHPHPARAATDRPAAPACTCPEKTDSAPVGIDPASFALGLMLGK